MSDDAYYNFMMPPSIWNKKPCPSRFKMKIAYAAECYPGATPILETREVRSPVGTATADSPYQRGSRVLKPEDEAYHAWLISRIGAPGEGTDNPPHEPS